MCASLESSCPFSHPANILYNATKSDIHSIYDSLPVQHLLRLLSMLILVIMWWRQFPFFNYVFYKEALIIFSHALLLIPNSDMVRKISAYVFSTMYDLQYNLKSTTAIFIMLQLDTVFLMVIWSTQFVQTGKNMMLLTF